jgi:hypothetical protein
MANSGHTQTDYYIKYAKYKQKYLSYKSQLNGINGINGIHGGGPSDTRFQCNPRAAFADMCQEDANGLYRTKQSCINDCETKYINSHLVRANLKYESYKFELFIYDLLAEHLKVYIAGGSALGLEVLRILLNATSNAKSDTFDKYFPDFVALDLIRDWDFAAYTDKIITEDFRASMDELAAKQKLVPFAKTFILYELRNSAKIDDMALFEIKVLSKSAATYSNKELPLTTMTIRVTRRNLKHIFMFATAFYTFKTKQTPIDLELIKYMTSDIETYIPPYKHGFYHTTSSSLDTGLLSMAFVEFIQDFATEKKDPLLVQFFITHMQEPQRLFFRLLEKNIPKTNKLIDFFNKIKAEKPDWLLDVPYTEKMIEEFIKKLSQRLVDIYKEGMKSGGTKVKVKVKVSSNKSDINSTESSDSSVGDSNDGLERVTAFLDGMNVSRLEIAYENFGPKGIELISKLFKPLVDLIKTSFDSSKLSKTLIFLQKKGVF